MDIERILKTRENAIYYGIGEYQKDCFGWVGGNAPACFDDKYLSDKDNLYFYLTFQNPLNPTSKYLFSLRILILHWNITHIPIVNCCWLNMN